MFVRRTVSPVVCLTSLLCLTAISARCSAAGDTAAGDTATAPAVAPGAVSASVALKDVARGLESPTFAVRAAASERLANAQGPVVPLMWGFAKDGNLEAAIRAVGVLEAIYVSAEAKGDPAAVDAAEFALDELTRVGRPSVADRADVVLESHYDIRERRAVAAIERFHGVAKFGPPGELSNGWNARFNQIPPAVDRSGDSSKEKAELNVVIIGPKWTGGDEGLRQIARLTRLTGPFHKLYRIQGCPVSDEGITGLRTALPGLEIEVRGAAKLGITYAGAPGSDRGCVIQDVQEGESAANAGLHSQDRIIRFGNHEIDDFYTLVDLLRELQAGPDRRDLDRTRREPAQSPHHAHRLGLSRTDGLGDRACQTSRRLHAGGIPTAAPSAPEKAAGMKPTARLASSREVVDRAAATAGVRESFLTGRTSLPLRLSGPC